MRNSIHLTLLILTAVATADAGLLGKSNLFGRRQPQARVVRPYQHPTFGYHATQWRQFPGAYYPHEMGGLDTAYPAPLHGPTSEYIQLPTTLPAVAPRTYEPVVPPTAVDMPAPPKPPAPPAVNEVPASPIKVRQPWTTPKPAATPFQPIRKTTFAPTKVRLPTVRPLKK